MKIIEAMKQIKANKEKIAELMQRIQRNSAHLSIESPQYEDQQAKIKEWRQSALDTARDNVELLIRIQQTNLITPVTIQMGDKSVTKSVAEWVWRRREYAEIERDIWNSLTDRGLKEGHIQTSPGVTSELKIIRYYDPSERDKNLDSLRREKFDIDAALEVTNAVTELA